MHFKVKVAQTKLEKWYLGIKPYADISFMQKGKHCWEYVHLKHLGMK